MHPSMDMNSPQKNHVESKSSLDANADAPLNIITSNAASAKQGDNLPKRYKGQ